MKYEKLEKKIQKIKNKHDYYSLLNQICENDMDNIDVAKGFIEIVQGKKMTQKDEVKLLKKIKAIFQRHSANLDGDDSLQTWLEYIL